MSGNIVEIVSAFVASKYDCDEYNWFHNEFVTKTALKLADILKADKEIVELAARFHDIDYSRGYGRHTQDSAAFAEKFLRQKNYPRERIQQVRFAILCHTTSMVDKIENPSLEGKILFDADKMWGLTPAGFARSIAHLYKNDASYETMKSLLKKQLESLDKLFFKESKEMTGDSYGICKKFFDML